MTTNVSTSQCPRSAGELDIPSLEALVQPSVPAFVPSEPPFVTLLSQTERLSRLVRIHENRRGDKQAIRSRLAPCDCVRHPHVVPHRHGVHQLPVARQELRIE